MRTTSITVLSLLLGGCPMGSEVPISSAPSNQAVCEALKPDMPVKFHGLSIDADTKARIERANARFSAICS